MATAKRESMVKNFLNQRHLKKVGTHKPSHPLRGHRHLVTLSEEELSRREQGWNDRFTVDPPPKTNKVQSPAHSPTFSTPLTPPSKESKLRSERAQYGKRGAKRNREPKKPSSGKLVPLGILSKTPSEGAQPTTTREEKLRFKVLKAIDARETLLYQLSALILCTSVQESLFLPSRPSEPPTLNSAGRQQMRSRGGMALASTPLNRHGVNPGAMTNAREATKLAQQLATDLQVSGIQCVEALVEWMLEAGAQAETPPPFLWRGRNYFLKMFSDLDFAEMELQARGVNLDCFKQHNPLLIKPNQKLGRVLAAHSIIMEMIEFAKDMTPMELLALSGRMNSSSREEAETSNAKVESQPSLSAGLGVLNGNTDLSVHDRALERGGDNAIDLQALERQDHEYATDLVNLLDESLDFNRGSASHEGDANQNEKEYDDVEENKKNNTSEEQSDSPATGDDTLEEKLEPEEGNESRLGTLELDNGEAGDPIDNQSGYERNSMDESDKEDEQRSMETTIAPPPRSPIEGGTDDAPGSEQTNDTPVDEDTVDTNLEALSITIESGSETEQHSRRSNASENQSEYDNSFDADASGDVDDGGKHEDRADVQLEENKDAPDEMRNAEPDKTAALKGFGHDEVIESSALPDKPLTSRTEDNNGSEYDNSFDDDADEGKVNNHVGAESTATSPDAVVTTDTPSKTSNVPPLVGMQQDKHVADTESDQPAPATADLQTVSKRLANELKRWTFLEDENRPSEINARGCLTWCSTRTLKETLQRRSSISECLDGSTISMLEQYGLTVAEASLTRFLCSDVAQELDLASHLIQECQAILGDVCSVVADAIQTSLMTKNSLVSEIEIADVLETAETVRQEYNSSTWEYVKIATTLLLFLRAPENETLALIKGRSSVSVGLSRLVKVFYPYLINEPREKLSDNWNHVHSVLIAMGLPTNCLYMILDSMCKTLLLGVDLSGRSNQDLQNEDDLAVFPKITVICDREDILQSSVEYVWRHHLSSGKTMSIFSLFPFFTSSFGEKLVDGVKVEEGEGKGPLKEWFTLVGAQLASKWTQVPTRKVLAEAASTLVTANGNMIIIPGASNALCPGFQLEWEMNEGETIRRVVNKCVQTDTFLLDRSVSSHSFMASHLRISQPNTAVFEYVQGSESYWLNENTLESPETRNVLVFLGWILASALTHFSSIQLKIHPLFFRLLLDSQHCVTLEEIQLFDPQLFKSLSEMQDMKPSDFVEYLKFEGVNETMSVEVYTTKVLEEKFGPASGIGWQLECVRWGFTRVIGLDQLGRVGITEADLVTSICGNSGGSGDDFDVKEIFRVAADADFNGCRPLKKAFWQTVDGFGPQLKRKLIKFVTGVETLPLAGTEFLRIEMPFTAISSADHGKCLQMLPQSHTCDNTLELPHYWKALCWREQHNEHEPSVKLEGELALLVGKKLQDAVEYSSGYGLDSTSTVAGVLADKSEDDDDQLAKEESYDSLGLPALSEDQSAADVPIDDSPSSQQTSEHDQAEQEEAAIADEPETKPTEPFAAAVSPRSEECYDEDDDDWEEESMA